MSGPEADGGAAAPGAATAVLYWRPRCGFCARLRRRLTAAGVELDERNIWEDDAHAAAVRAVTGGDETVPTVVVGDRAMVNPSSRAVLAELGIEPPPGRLRSWLGRRGPG